MRVVRYQWAIDWTDLWDIQGEIDTCGTSLSNLPKLKEINPISSCGFYQSQHQLGGPGIRVQKCFVKGKTWTMTIVIVIRDRLDRLDVGE